MPGQRIHAPAFFGFREQAVHIIETILIIIALLSLLALVPGYDWAGSPWYKFGWLSIILVAMAWVARRRLARTRDAAEEAKRKRDEAERTGRPPWRQG